MTIRVAFVGTGTMARLHLHALRRVKTPHQVVGVHDRDEQAAQEFSGVAGAPSYRTLAELLTDAEPNLVHICTPAGTHFAPARQALLTGKGAHIYVEKPFVDSAAEARELLARHGGEAPPSGLRGPSTAA
jgi:predicted dehydrogenase